LKKDRINLIITLILTVFLIIGYLSFIKDTFEITFSSHLSLSFVLYILLFSPLLTLPFFFLKLYNKWGRRYFLYLFFIVFYCITFFVFIKTISFSEKYRFFDPFLQINPVLSSELYTCKADNEIRILMLGGSTTKGDKLPPDLRYPILLKKKLLKKYPDKKINVFNAGMDWFTTRHSLIAYTNFYRSYNADIVIIMHTINDVIRSFTPLMMASDAFKYDYSHFYGPSAYAAFPQKSFPEKLINNIKNFYNQRILNKKDIVTDYNLSAYKSSASYKYFYSTLINEISRDGAIPVIVSEPSIYCKSLSENEKHSLWFAKEFCYNQSENDYKPYGKHIASTVSLMNAMNYFNGISEKIAYKNKIPFLSLDVAIPKNSTYFFDDVHFTEKGADKAAEVVADFLIKNRLIEKK